MPWNDAMSAPTRSSARAITGLLLLTATLGCSLDVKYSPQLPSLLSVVNAAPATSSVSAYLNAAVDPLVSGLTYKSQTSGCASIYPTTQQLTFTDGASVLASTTADFGSAGEYTAVIVNAGATYRAVALSDGQTVVAGNNALRFINATSSAGDVYVTTPSGTPGASTKVVGNLAPLATSNEIPPYVQRPESDVRVRLYDVGTTATPRADFTITALQPSHRTTIVFTEPTGAPGDPGVFQAHPCS